MSNQYNSEVLVEAIGMLLESESGPRTDAVVLRAMPSEGQRVRTVISATAGGRSWRHETQNYVATYDARQGGAFEYSDGRVELIHATLREVPEELWPLCPLKIPMWDRSSDNWRMTSAARRPGGILVKLASRLDRRFGDGELFVDSTLRLATVLRLGDVDIKVEGVVRNPAPAREGRPAPLS